MVPAGESFRPWMGKGCGPGWGIILALGGETLWPHLGNHFGPEWGTLLALDSKSTVFHYTS